MDIKSYYVSEITLEIGKKTNGRMNNWYVLEPSSIFIFIIIIFSNRRTFFIFLKMKCNPTYKKKTLALSIRNSAFADKTLGMPTKGKSKIHV